MPISDAFTYVPLVGDDNIARIQDSSLAPDVDFRPVLFDPAGDYVPKNSFGDGEPPDGPSVLETSPVGRPGSLRTTLQIQALENIDILKGLEFAIMVNIPPGMQGLVPTGLTEAQINDPDNWPIVDPSQWLPRVTLTDSEGPWAYAESLGPTQGFPFVMNQFNVFLPPGHMWGSEFLFYTPPQSYDTLSGFIFPPGSVLQANAYGTLFILFTLFGIDDNQELDQGADFTVDIDFSHSITN
jgi:hypothetical protein